MGPFGLTFAPTADAADDRNQGRTGGAPQGEQSAVKVIQLALPRVVGSRAPLAAPLLQRPAGGGGGANLAVLQSILRAMLGDGATLPSTGAPGVPVGGGPESTRALVQALTSAQGRQTPYFQLGEREGRAPMPNPIDADPGVGGGQRYDVVDKISGSPSPFPRAIPPPFHGGMPWREDGT